MQGLGAICGGVAGSLAAQVRLCPEHALQLFHRKNQEAMRQQRKALKREQREQGGRGGAGGEGDALHAGAAPGGRKRQRAGGKGGAAAASVLLLIVLAEACSEDRCSKVLTGWCVALQVMKDWRGNTGMRQAAWDPVQWMVRALQQEGMPRGKWRR